MAQQLVWRVERGRDRFTVPSQTGPVSSGSVGSRRVGGSSPGGAARVARQRDHVSVGSSRDTRCQGWNVGDSPVLFAPCLCRLVLFL